MGRLARQPVEAVRRLGEPWSWPVAGLQSSPVGMEAAGPQAPAVGSAPGPCALRRPVLAAPSPRHTARPPDNLRMRQCVFLGRAWAGGRTRSFVAPAAGVWEVAGLKETVFASRTPVGDPERPRPPHYSEGASQAVG